MRYLKTLFGRFVGIIRVLHKHYKQHFRYIIMYIQREIDMAQSFKEWWSSVPADLKSKGKFEDWQTYKPLLGDLRSIIKECSTTGRCSIPSDSDLKHWVKSGEIDAVIEKNVRVWPFFP